MPVRVGLLRLSVILLCSQASWAWAQSAAELPTSAEYRSRMIQWSAEREASVETEAQAESLAPRSEATEQIRALPRLSSRYGVRRDPLGGRTRLHAGIDIPGPVGTAVRAAQAGEVRRAGSAGSYGRMVEIDHGNGFRTRYAHLSRISVGPGERVAEGQLIGLMGSTGRSTGSHLHFEVRRGGTSLDPLDFLGPSREGFTVETAPLDAARPHISDFARRRGAGVAGSGAGSDVGLE